VLPFTFIYPARKLAPRSLNSSALPAPATADVNRVQSRAVRENNSLFSSKAIYGIILLKLI